MVDLCSYATQIDHPPPRPGRRPRRRRDLADDRATCKGTIERCRTDLASYSLATQERDLIDERLSRLWDAIDKAPKTSKWRWRAKVGERVRWYEEPEEEGQTD